MNMHPGVMGQSLALLYPVSKVNALRFLFGMRINPPCVDCAVVSYGVSYGTDAC